MSSYERLRTAALLGPVALLVVVGFLIAVSSGARREEGGFSLKGTARATSAVLAKLVVYAAGFVCLQEIMRFRG